MKKVLLLAAVAFGLNASAQDAMNSRLMQAEITPDAAAREKIEDLHIRGGAVDGRYDYNGYLYQYYDSDMVLGAITTTPDSTTVIVYSDGTPGYSFNHAVGGIYDFSFYGWGNDLTFADGDQVTVDSLHVVGGYEIYDGTATDKIRFTIFKGADGFADPFSGVQYNAGTWALLPATVQPTAKTMAYAGNTGNGLAGGPTATSTVVIEKTLTVSDSGIARISVEVPNNGFNMMAEEILGVFVEYVPGGLTTSDTINYQTGTGDINPFYFYYYREANTQAPQGVFISEWDTTSTNTSNFLFNTTRYSAHPAASSWRNDQTSINMSYSHEISITASGTSTFGIQNEDLTTVSIFPNPSNGVVNVELDTDSDATITVVDVLGQVVYTSNENFTAGERKMIDLSSNAKGMYILSVEGEGVNTVERITIK